MTPASLAKISASGLRSLRLKYWSASHIRALNTREISRYLCGLLAIVTTLALPGFSAAQGQGVGCPAYCLLVTSSGAGSASLSITPIVGTTISGASYYYPYYVVTAGGNTYTLTSPLNGGTGTGASVTGTISGLANGLISISVYGTTNNTTPSEGNPEGTETGQVTLFNVPADTPTLTLNENANSLSTTTTLNTNASGTFFIFVGSSSGSEAYYGSSTADVFTYTGGGVTCFQVATSSTAIFSQRSGEVCVYLYDPAATPTLPDWAAILLGLSLFGIALRFRGRFPQSRWT